MFSRIGKRFTLTNGVMMLALVFVMTGGAYAAGKYVITSTKQIKPSVLKQLKGKEGATDKEGPAGKEGSAGKEGPTGKEGLVGKEGKAGLQGEKGTQGANGPQGATGQQGTPGATGATGLEGKAACSAGANGCELPAGASEHGQWVIDELGASHAFTAISFVIPLQADPKGHYIGTNKELAGEENESPAIKSGECTGSVTKPEAAGGNLCVFAAASSKATFAGAAGFINNEGASPIGVGQSGTLLNFNPESSTEEAAVRGVWVVTG